MASITIKDIPSEVHEKLIERAMLNRRSLNAEIIECLESIFRVRRIDPEQELERIKQVREEIGLSLTDELTDELLTQGELNLI